MTTRLEDRRPLPRGWRWARLGEVCERNTGTRDPRQAPDAPFHYVDITSVDNISKKITGSKILLGKDAPSRARQVIREGDVLLSATRPNLNGVAMVPPEFDGHICSTGFCVLRALMCLDRDYLFFFVRSSEFVAVLSDLVQGALYPAVTDRQIRDQFIPLPPLAEQKRIAAIINDQMAAVERARAAATGRLEATKALPAVFLGAVFDSAGVRRWPVKYLGDVGEIVSGITLGRKVNGAVTRSVPYLRVANVKDGFLDLTEIRAVDATSSEISRLKLRQGDLLLTEGGDPDKLGRGTFWRGEISECIHQNHIFRVRLDKSAFLPEFVSAQIGSRYGKAYFLAHAKQTTGIATINRRVLARFPLRVASMVEQRRITAILSEQISAVERARNAVEEEMKAVNILPAMLLRSAFNGEL